MNAIFETIESLTGLGKKDISLYGMWALLAVFVLGYGQDYIFAFLGLAYPIFASFIAMETNSKDDDRQWLTYWVVFGVVRQCETYFSIFTTFIPFYIFFRLGFYIWLYHPSTMGASWFYRNILQSWSQEYADAMKKVRGVIEGIEDQIVDVKDQVDQLVNDDEQENDTDKSQPDDEAFNEDIIQRPEESEPEVHGTAEEEVFDEQADEEIVEEVGGEPPEEQEVEEYDEDYMLG